MEIHKVEEVLVCFPEKDIEGTKALLESPNGKYIVYWLKSSQTKRKFGIIFEGSDNCVTDEIVSGITLSQSMFGDMLDELENNNNK